jgi:hypothetical protein
VLLLLLLLVLLLLLLLLLLPVGLVGQPCMVHCCW